MKFIGNWVLGYELANYIGIGVGIEACNFIPAEVLVFTMSELEIFTQKTVTGMYFAGNVVVNFVSKFSIFVPYFAT